MDIGGWLRSLGLERYETVFRENEINKTVLPNLTAEDLKDLGVVFSGTAASSSMLSPRCAADASVKQPPPTVRPGGRRALKTPPNAAKSR